MVMSNRRGGVTVVQAAPVVKKVRKGQIELKDISRRFELF